MVWLSIPTIVLRLAWPHLLTPWRSPLLRWRLETYGISGRDGRVLHADEIGPQEFFRFLIERRANLLAFLRWSSRL